MSAKKKTTPGYLVKQKAKGKVYLMLKKTYRQGNKVSSQSLYSFGAMPDALEKMYWLRENPEEFPKELKEKGFDLADLYDWILTIETRQKKNGKPFDVFNSCYK
ncbi:hypothetical protein GCM10009865_54930 [Aeromicrobium ponti]|uniref:Uncharacterized protein n=1 Tax=Cytobacillus oceanisediminis TaxID=665099 RepID=A0A562J1G9_9BACI|nr:hypothetical protein [Cytobacillus oceanisediminis]TWH77089.1 hypothetical protein IQ19_05637 [Cytobacillus oceanisediminis]